MKTLYLDHQYIAREAGGQPAHWQQLGAMLAANSEWRLAVSECNLLEIASDDVNARAHRRRATKSTGPIGRLEHQRPRIRESSLP